MQKPRIAIVAGEMRHPRVLTMFDALRDRFDVTVYALDGERLLDRQGTGIKVRIFENIPDMPGYLRGLEDELASTSFIIGLETSRLGTFQAVRAARKHGIPMGVLVTEFHPYFYEKYANIRAIQFDICNKSEVFWATSQQALDALTLDYVPKEAIRVVGPAVDQGKFRPSPEGRKKFREYIGISPEEFVVLFHHELEEWNRPEVLVQALALASRQLGPQGRSVRVLFAGAGKAAMDLKYRAFDLGLGRQVMFLHQDPEPFILDLYAASDVQVMPRPLRTDFHEDFPLPLLEAMATGLVPLVGAGSIAAELAGEGAVTFADDTHQALAAAIVRVARHPDELKVLRQKAMDRVSQRFSLESVRDILIQDVVAIIGGQVQSLAVQDADTDTLVASVRADISRGADQDALLKIEEAMLREVKSNIAKGELFCLRGDAFYGLGDIDRAMQSYGEAVRLNDRDYRALRGLGFVAWQGHSNEEALVFFKKAMAIEENDAETSLGIGLVFRRLGLNDEALFWLEKCVLSPEPPAASTVALAQACAQIKAPHRGIMVLERVLDAVGDNHTLMVTLGQLYLSTGQTDAGNAMLQKALGAMPAA